MPNGESPTQDQALESLRKALALLEASASERAAAEANSVASAEAAQANDIARAAMLLGQTLRQAADQQPELRSALQLLSQWLADLAQPAPAEPSSSEVTVGARAKPASLQGPTQPVRLRIGGVDTQLNVRGTEDEVRAARQAAEQARISPVGVTAASSSIIYPPPDLPLIRTRCRLKADGCRWAVARRRLLNENASYEESIRPKDAELVGHARMLPNCYIWAVDPRMVQPPDEVLRECAGGYDNLAAAIELADLAYNDKQRDQGLLAEAYILLAEAQSALRAAVSDLGVRDYDQNDAFAWLRTRTFEDRVLVSRHMKLDDPADPSNWEDLGQRIADLRGRFDSLRSSESERRRLFNKAKYHARRLTDGNADDPRPDWLTLVAALQDLVRMGVPPSHIDIREMVLPLIERVPEDLDMPEGFARILDSVDEYLLSREMEPATGLRFRAPSPEVEEAAKLLEGGAAVLIGGDCRPQAQQALERELRLSELRWIAAAHSQSHFTFEPLIARPDTVVVLLAIRWSAHSFENAKTLCERYGKPFVRLPGGYNPNQVARQILDQVGDQLRQRRNAAQLI